MKKKLSILDKNKPPPSNKGTLDHGSDSEVISDSDEEIWQDMEIIGAKKNKKRKNKDIPDAGDSKKRKNEVSKRKRKHKDAVDDSNVECLVAVDKRKVKKLLKKEKEEGDDDVIFEKKKLTKRRKQMNGDVVLKRVKMGLKE